MGRKAPRVSLRQLAANGLNAAVSACKGKKAYDTQPQAEVAKAHGEKSRPVKLGVYRCPVCDLWHLTSK